MDVSVHQSEASVAPSPPLAAAAHAHSPQAEAETTRGPGRLRGGGGARAAMKASGDDLPSAPALGGPRAQVSIILPVHNAERWLDECLRSVLHQDFEGTMELSIFNDASKDKSMTVIETWKIKLEDSGILVVIGGHDSPSPRGVGYSKNRAIAQSSGTYLCFLDSDDVMMPERVRLQLEAAAQHPCSIIGCQVMREPPDSTERYTRWINQLSPDQLITQVFTSHGPTVIMPTWFCSRAWFSHVGWFDEGGQGVPEDLLFFQEHLRRGGHIVRVDHSLVLYRYHAQAASHTVLEGTIWTLRVRFLEERVLPHWTAFTIWNAGKQGRRLYRSLGAANRQKVVAFCDIDERKVKKGFYCYEDSQERPKPRVPILHFRDAQPPFIICVKLDLTGGVFEDNLQSLHLQEGQDFFHFS
ncbi:PREDICTED: UDP-GlcNAc:betaGal beta-1,3-N-acetylglucosaminyltransferase-like protein 1 [Elephantulus edwardii]|uniref:UDP-GlcNAc:betaGal beta-1,3-N-acetylglucosaminyltransferase-like protein 1 n=1 Tax=Elephantulus edwardii TaxID=28737 RepID=UPI0003F0BD42|nr:PREDICTED: UDP-GlcNAc:betaGal beta-1,3-N-acetylglucosaminyltransferase-like protein 1 [Elephantulus edwardii]